MMEIKYLWWKTLMTEDIRKIKNFYIQISLKKMKNYLKTFLNKNK